AVLGIIINVLDNLIKPLLIGRCAGVLLWVIFIGVIGGSIGFIGIFIGPLLMAAGYSIVMSWLSDVIGSTSWARCPLWAGSSCLGAKPQALRARGVCPLGNTQFLFTQSNLHDERLQRKGGMNSKEGNFRILFMAVAKGGSLCR